MGRRVEATVVTLGLCGALFTSSFAAENGSETEVATSLNTPGNWGEKPVSLGTIQGIGRFLVLSPSAPGVLALPETPTPAEPESSLPLIETSSVSPVEKQRAARATEYVKRVLKPVAKQEGFVIVDPINTQNDPVNLSGQFIVTTPRAKKSDKTCAMQFTVTPKGNGHANNIQVAVYGNVELLGNGEEYGHSSYNGDLGHNEGVMTFGKDFNSKMPSVAAAYMHQTFTKFCRVPSE